MDGTNWYAYCNNDPVNFVDPWGLEEARDKNVLTSDDYGKIQMLTAIYNYGKYTMEDNAIADAAHIQAIKIRQQEKYRDTEGYGPVRTTAEPGVLQFAVLLGAVDNYKYLKTTAKVTIKIGSPLTTEQVDSLSGNNIKTFADSGCLSLIADFLGIDVMTETMIMEAIVKLNENYNPLYGKVALNDVIVTVTKTQPFNNKRLEFYFHKDNKSEFYYVME